MKNINLNIATQKIRLTKKAEGALHNNGGYNRKAPKSARALALEELSQRDKLKVEDNDELDFPCAELKAELVAGLKARPEVRMDKKLRERLETVTVVPKPIEGKAKWSKGKAHLEDIVRLRFKNKLSLAQIGELCNVSGSTVAVKLKKYLERLPDVTTISKLDSIRGDIIKGTLFNQLSALNDPSKIKKASLNNVAYSAGQLHNMLRLEEGKSTQNIFSAEYFAFIKERGQLPAGNPPIDIIDESETNG